MAGFFNTVHLQSSPRHRAPQKLKIFVGDTRPGAIAFFLTSKLGGMQWIPAFAGMTRVLRARLGGGYFAVCLMMKLRTFVIARGVQRPWQSSLICFVTATPWVAGATHPPPMAVDILQWGAEVPLRWRGGTQ